MLNIARQCLWMLPVVFLTACASLRNQEPVDPPAPDLPKEIPPIVSDRFLLTDDGQRVVGELQIIRTRHEDTFVDIARTYNLGFDELVQANPDVDPWLPGAGTEILLPTRFILPDAPNEGIVINIASKRLFYFPEPDLDGARVVITFPIGIGQEGSATPLGETTVTSKGRDPVWYLPASIRREYAAAGNPLPAMVQPGPDNPLGRHVLILGMPSYLIHGTNRPSGVGMRVSHGCVRLFPENIEFLFDHAPVGVKVNIVNQPWLIAWQEDRLLFEVHPRLEDDKRDWSSVNAREMLAKIVRDRVPEAELPDELRVQEIVETAQGVPLAVTPADADSAALSAGANFVHNLIVFPELKQVAARIPAAIEE